MFIIARCLRVLWKWLCSILCVKTMKKKLNKNYQTLVYYVFKSKSYNVTQYVCLGFLFCELPIHSIELNPFLSLSPIEKPTFFRLKTQWKWHFQLTPTNIKFAHSNCVIHRLTNNENGSFLLFCPLLQLREKKNTHSFTLKFCMLSCSSASLGLYKRHTKNTTAHH